MTRISNLSTGTALATILSVGAATADVTGPEVWADLKEYYAAMGYEVSGLSAQSGDRFTVSGITFKVDLEDGQGTVMVGVPDMVFVDQGNGTVAMDVPLTYPATIVGAPAGGAPGFEAKVTMTMDKMDITVAGDPGDLKYTYDGENVRVALDQLTVGGEDESGILQLVATMTQMDGTATLSKGNARTMSQNFDLGDVTIDLDVDDPMTGEKVMMDFAIATVAFTTDAQLPLDFDPKDPMAVLSPDVSGAATLTTGAAQTAFDASADGEQMQGTSRSAGSQLSIRMLDQVVDLSLGAQEVGANFTGGGVPFPVEYAAGGYGFNLKLPFGKSDADASDPFGMLLRLDDFTMSDLLWSLFDPGAQLPRDAASILIDVSGLANILVDVTDQADLDQVGQGKKMPAEVTTLAVNSLVLDAVGAKLTGNADFDIDNSDLETYDGIPKPIGEANLTLTGANKLIDTLVNMGLVPQEQAMGARMMMSMFAQPAGDDALSSRIELNEQGHILANGQRIR